MEPIWLHIHRRITKIREPDTGGSHREPTHPNEHPFRDKITTRETHNQQALDLHKELPQIRILTDSAFSINTLRNYAIDPLNFTHHPHKDLLNYTNNLIKARDEQGLLTQIGKVKSHTGVTYNDEADTGNVAW
jgi:hypothetical protein